PYYVDEDYPLNVSRTYPEVRDLAEVDQLVSAFLWRHPEVATTILRPVPILGYYTHSAIGRYLKQRYVPTIMGFNPMMQFIHEEAPGRCSRPSRRCRAPPPSPSRPRRPICCPRRSAGCSTRSGSACSASRRGSTPTATTRGASTSTPPGARRSSPPSSTATGSGSRPTTSSACHPAASSSSPTTPARS